MEPDRRSQLAATLVRILTKENGRFITADGTADYPAIGAEAVRLLDEDPDFADLAQNWPANRGPLKAPFGLGAESLDELRAEIERLRLFRAHPLQEVRYRILVSGAVAGTLWAFLSGALDSEELEGTALALQVLVVSVAFGVGAFFAWGIATAKSREVFYKILKPDLFRHGWWGLFTLAGLLVVILMFATLGFAGVSELLYLHGIAETDPQRALDDPLWDSMVFYVWSFLDAIPVLEIPQTLRWNLGFEFTDHVNPVLLLAYKVAVIGPAIATARLAWEARRLSRT